MARGCTTRNNSSWGRVVPRNGRDQVAGSSEVVGSVAATVIPWPLTLDAGCRATILQRVSEVLRNRLICCVFLFYAYNCCSSIAMLADVSVGLQAIHSAAFLLSFRNCPQLLHPCPSFGISGCTAQSGPGRFGWARARAPPRARAVFWTSAGVGSFGDVSCPGRREGVSGLSRTGPAGRGDVTTDGGRGWCVCELSRSLD